MVPASRTSSAPTGTGNGTRTEFTGARIDTFASVLALRTAASTASAGSRSAASAPAATADSSAPSGHEARWTEPSRHHDHTSSVT